MAEDQIVKPLVPFVYILHPEAAFGIDQTDMVRLTNEHGKDSACDDFRKLLVTMGYKNVETVTINLQSYKTILKALKDKHSNSSMEPDYVILNLCDGTETDGYPGASVIIEMEALKMPYTGSDYAFYHNTTSKPFLKRMLIKENVPTSDFIEITSSTTFEEIEKLKDWPLIVKPSVSYASISISEKSIVHTPEEVLERVKYAVGVDGRVTGVFVERFLAGREFTVFVSGDSDSNKVFKAVERVFDSKLGTYQRMLAFDRYWDGYDLEGNEPSTDEMSFFKYHLAPEPVQPILQDLALRAYLACGGSGYGRVDIRTDSIDSFNPFVLEVNSNCGISVDQTDGLSSTVCEILKLSKESFTKFANDLLEFALTRFKKKNNQK
jgi:D-alanine-D-alanine ligase-like ATP-grasp enzyme